MRKRARLSTRSETLPHQSSICLSFLRRVATAFTLAALSLAAQLAASENTRNEVPFKLYRGYAIVARGSIGNLKNLNFLIDTGAVPSVLDRRIADRLHLTGTLERLSVFTQKLDAEHLIARNVQLAAVRSDSLPVAVQDLSFAEEALGTRIDAMIGYDFLGQSAFTIDYESKKIIFGLVEISGTTLPYESSSGYVVVEMRVRQKILRLVVDTGASNLVLFEDAAHDCEDAIVNMGSRTWSNMGGQVRVKQVQLKDAYLGSLPWGSQDTFILVSANGYTPGGLGGLLGLTSIKPRRIGFDPDRMVLVLDPPSMPPQSLKRESSPSDTPDPNPTLTIQLYNYSTASPATLAGAEREAGRILGQAGLRASWLKCSVGPSSPQDPCRKAPQATDIRIRILAAPVLDKFQDSVFGFAIHPVLASVYYEFALRRARSDDAEFELPIILGCVMAHELGHLLLGSNSHSNKGIMLPRWKVNEVRQLMTGRLLFTPDQSRLMRLEARARAERQILASTSSAP
jgi:predicted aspartyl protease